MLIDNYVRSIERDGFTIVPTVLNDETISLLVDRLTRIPLARAVSQRGGITYGIRNLLNIVPLARDIANSQVIRLIGECCI
jgi:hypothetical protein